MGHRIENGTLFIDAGEPYLEHHGVLGMKWGKHLRAGKGPASAPASAGGGGGGAPEEDEETKKKIEEAAKKAGMTADEYRKKFADKVAEIKKAAYNAAGGSHKKNATEYRKMSRDAFNEARKYEASGNADLAKAASAKRKGNTSAHSSYKSTGDNAKDEARRARERASALSEGARQEQARYEKSLAGKYDKMKADRERKRKMKRRKMIEDAFRTKHSDDTDAIYTEGTRLVVNSKWG